MSNKKSCTVTQRQERKLIVPQKRCFQLRSNFRCGKHAFGIQKKLFGFGKVVSIKCPYEQKLSEFCLFFVIKSIGLNIFI